MANNLSGIKTKERIIETAKDLFYQNGYNETSCNDICKKIGIRLGNLHYHYNNKIEIAETIYNEMMDYYQRRLSELFPDEDELNLLVLSVCIHQKRLFEDSLYRKFSLQYTKERMCDISLDEYRAIIPGGYHYLAKHLDPIQTDFCFSAIAGIDIRIESYINENIDTLNYEQTAKYTNQLYFSITNNQNLNPIIDYALTLARRINISSDGFSMSLDRID